MAAVNPKPRRFRARISIRWRLLAATVIVGAVVVGIAFSGLQRIHVLNARLTRIVDYSAEKVKLAVLLKQDLVSVTRAEKNLILARQTEAMMHHGVVIDETVATMREHQERLYALVDEDDRRQLERFTEIWEEWKNNHRAVREFAQINSHGRAIELALGKGRESFEQLEQALTAVTKSADDRVQAARGGASQAELATLGAKLNLVAQLMSDAARLQQAEKELLLAASEQDMVQQKRALQPLQNDLHGRLQALQTLAAKSELPWLREAEEAFQDYVRTLAEMQDLVETRGNFFVYQFARDIGDPLAMQCEQIVDTIVARNKVALQAYREESHGTYVAARNTLFGLSAVGLLISVTVTFVTGQRIAGGLRRLANYARQVQQTGDLSRAVPCVENDEIGMLADAFDHMRQSLYRQTNERAALNEALERSNEQLRNFAHTVAHEVKSPLSVVASCLNLLAEKHVAGCDPETHGLVQDACSATRGMLDLVNELLDFARVDFGDQEFDEVDLEAVFYQAYVLMRPALKDAGAALTHDPLPVVRGNEVQLRQLLQNLIGNAVKYRSDRPLAIHVGVDPQTAPEGATHGTFHVRDNGLGIAPEHRQRIFDAFVRLSHPRDVAGSGIGLAFCKRIVEHHGGRIWVESEPDQGSDFCFTLPQKTPC
jgi:signal transduction histidine kinase